MKIIKGKVVKGKSRGKGLGFPTANILIYEKIDQGIFISFTRVEDRKYPSLTFIGAPVTFGEEKVGVETYILDFSTDLYDKEIEIELLKKIRNNKKFKSKDDLIKQMEDDKNKALEYFKKNV